jgi:hypothetical protein
LQLVVQIGFHLVTPTDKYVVSKTEFDVEDCLESTCNSGVTFVLLQQISFHQNSNCARLSAPMHEIGHNIGFWHSGLAATADEYGDTSGKKKGPANIIDCKSSACVLPWIYSGSFKVTWATRII